MRFALSIRRSVPPARVSRTPGRAALAVAMAASTGLAGVVGLASPASAAPPADCVDALYLTDGSNGGRVLRLGLDGSIGTTTVYDPTTGSTGNPNQLGISAGGTRIVNTDRTTGRIVNYELGSEVLTDVAAPGLPANGIAGAINPADGLYYYGGYSGSNLLLFSYDPVAGTSPLAAPTATSPSTRRATSTTSPPPVASSRSTHTADRHRPTARQPVSRATTGWAARPSTASRSAATASSTSASPPWCARSTR
jgi:hypothetical protein